ncbi:MAG: hypothetical protein ACLQFF_04180 [Steroidobacteraceae bacterium]
MVDVDDRVEGRLAQARELLIARQQLLVPRQQFAGAQFHRPLKQRPVGIGAHIVRVNQVEQATNLRRQRLRRHIPKRFSELSCQQPMHQLLRGPRPDLR